MPTPHASSHVPFARRALSTLLIVLGCATPAVVAQSLQDLEFGEDATFEVATWNIEWFPKHAQTMGRVSEIIAALEIDLLALQEINDTDAIQELVDGLPGYEAYYDSVWPAGLAYVYRSAALTIVDSYEIYTTQPYWSAFPRSPMVLEVEFDGELVIVINNHFKCCGDGLLNQGDLGDEETRRWLASNLLRDYIALNHPDDRVVVLGDLNDILTDAPAHNVFEAFLDEPDFYAFVDAGIATGASADWSYPSWPSHLDHILVTDELFGAVADSAAEVACIRVDDFMPGGWSAYDSQVSDHRPVALKVPLGGSLCPTEVTAVETVRLGSPPNPDALKPGATSAPVLGATWDPRIDHTTFATDATADGLILALFPLNVPSGKGTLLCDIGVGSPYVLVPLPVGAALLLPLPVDCALAGLSLSAQGYSVTPTGTKLTNALDFTIGTNDGN